MKVMSGTHSAVEYTVDGQRECRVCGARVVGRGPNLRHEGEAVAVVAPAPADVPAFTDAIAAVRAAITRLPPGASDADVSRAVVQAVYGRGLLRRRRSRGAVPAPDVVAPIPDRYEVPDRLARV